METISPRLPLSCRGSHRPQEPHLLQETMKTPSTTDVMHSTQRRLDTKPSYMGDAHIETDFREV